MSCLNYDLDSNRELTGFVLWYPDLRWKFCPASLKIYHMTKLYVRKRNLALCLRGLKTEKARENFIKNFYGSKYYYSFSWPYGVRPKKTVRYDKKQGLLDLEV